MNLGFPDSYLRDACIKANEIDYIWLDVEGHEVEVLEGATETLLSGKIPLISEFNALVYINNNTLNRYSGIVKKIYKSFIDCRNEDTIYPIDKLEDFALKLVKIENLEATDLFFF